MSVATVFILLISAIYIPLSLNNQGTDNLVKDNSIQFNEPTFSQTVQEGNNTPDPKPNDQEIIIPSENSTFELYFIDVGQADSALVLCDGKAMLIDEGNVADSSLIYSYLKKHEIGYLDYIICSHPHEDHVGGLAGALNYASVGIAYCPVTKSR